MKVLVTGASGFIGKPLLEQLLANGHEVVTLSRAAPTQHQNEHICCDLLTVDQQQLKALLNGCNFDALIHLAWDVSTPAFWHSEQNLKWLSASEVLFNVFFHSGGRFILGIGSCAEFSNISGLITEQTITQPDSKYGKAKVATREKLEALCSEQGRSCAWARLFYPYGQGELDHKLIPSLIDYFTSSGQTFKVNMDDVKDYIHINDTVAALLFILEHQYEGVFNIGTGEKTKISDIVRYVRSSLPTPLNLKPVEDSGVVTPMVVPCMKKLNTLGWRQKIALSEGIKQLVNIKLKGNGDGR